MERLPCGCHIGTDIIEGVKSFLIEPCRLQCDIYLFVIEETARQGKPVTTVDVR